MDVMNESSGLKIQAVCEDCKESFSVTNENLVYGQRYESEDKSIFLSYYDCPKCGRRHYVQVDDHRTMEILDKCKKQFVKLSVLKNKGQTISKKLSVKFEKDRKHLGIARSELMKAYQDKTIHNPETGEDIVLRFSI